MSFLVGWWRKWIASPERAAAPGVATSALLGEAAAHLDAGRDADAEAALRAVLDVDPDDGDAHNLLGLAAARGGRTDEARAHFEEAIDCRPGLAAAHVNLGSLLHGEGRPEEAAARLRAALAIDPGLAEAHAGLGAVLVEAGRVEDAEPHFRAALERQPERAEAHGNLGNALRDLGRLEEAEPLLRRAVALAPDAPEAHLNLGNLLAGRGRLEAAAEALERALALGPDLARAHNGLGNVRRRQGRLADAARAYDAALGLAPEFAEARWNRALLHLLEGDYASAWPGFEARFELGPLARLRAGYRALPAARWDGAPFPGRTLLVWAEQGFGDTLQFVRYLPRVKALGGDVVLECQPALVRLLDGVTGADAVRASDDPCPRPPFDLQVPLLSLPALLGTTAGTIPADVPYLRANPGLTGAWRARLAGDGLRIGLVWAGKPDPDPNRSMRLADAAPLGEIPGVSVHSLQVGPGVEEIAAAPAGRRPVDLGRAFGDFADTAAAMDALDLVVTIDTAAAHLAGALGRPVWTLLPFAPDWRWLCARGDSPWYPTMRLFRQPRPGDWVGPVAEAAAALARGELEPGVRAP